MNKLMSLLVVSLFAVGVANAQIPAGTVTMNGGNLVDSTGTVLTSGTIYFAPVDANGAPTSYRMGAVGQALSRPISATVTNGAFATRLPDTSLTSPTNVCFSVTVVDNATGENVLGGGYTCVQPTGATNDWCSVGSCNFDLYTPNLTPAEQQQVRPTGPTGPVGCVSGVSCTSFLTPQNLNGVLYATQFSGPDIGAKVNAAILSLATGTGNGCGEVIIPAGSYSQTTTINKPRCVALKGSSGRATILNWFYGTGVAIIAADTAGPFDFPEGNISDLTISGTGIASASIGIYIGGDPAGVISPSTAWGDHQNFNSVRVLNFGTGVQWGNNAWSNTFLESNISSNGVGLYFPTNVSNSGEAISVISTRIQANTQGLNLLGIADFYFYGGSCDYNNTCGTVSQAHFYGEHFEQLNGLFLTAAGNSQAVVEIFGGWASYGSATGTDAAMFYVNSVNNPLFWIDGTLIVPGHHVTNLVNWHGSGGGAILEILNLPSYTSGSLIGSLTNSSCTFIGCHIQDDNGNYAFHGTNAKVELDGSANFKSVTTQNGVGASIGNVSGFGSLTGNGSGLSLFPIIGSTKQIFLTDGFINAPNTEAIFKSFTPIGGAFAPSGACTTAGQLIITGGDGHATYCKVGTLIWTTLY